MEGADKLPLLKAQLVAGKKLKELERALKLAEDEAASPVAWIETKTKPVVRYRPGKLSPAMQQRLDECRAELQVRVAKLREEVQIAKQEVETLKSPLAQKEVSDAAQ
eukprot:CAMPEP_0184552172 /NCGR_PEP_ID=MMETSP0199_2-20130426/28094_1 /TAXON_ID=1112570 /ORGANISM="Thraustochytrium sp., Strain LLF1b" /LENGTH=106 /DNA_ID=CAMNT_0026947595 /DNA_START=82 /DNA_END=402 /DNA_ORIENTATION=-